MRIFTRSSRIALILGIVGLLADPHLSSAPAQTESETDELPPPWELTRREEGESRFAPTLRLRDAEPRYRETPWWNGYAQMRAHVEAGLGNHAAALAAWDSGITPRDSVGSLPPGIVARGAVEYLSAVADTVRVIMINERHHAASDRLLTLELLPVLRDKGFRYFAAEAFDPADTEINAREYPVEATGTYVRDPVLAEVVREAIRLGYTLVAYEHSKGAEEEDADLTPQQRRDLGQARNLARATIERDPEAKVLVHAGYSHVLEEASERFSPMALYFRELTGVDPVTVDQTRLSERSDPAWEHPDRRAGAAAGLLGESPVILVDSSGRPYSPADFAVDLQVLGPRSSYANGRPDWMSLGGRRRAVSVEIPEVERGWCFVEARVAGEPPEAIALDGCEVRDSREARLFLPPDADVVLRVLGADGGVLRTESMR
jgi:hypothetical protein